MKFLKKIDGYFNDAVNSTVSFIEQIMNPPKSEMAAEVKLPGLLIFFIYILPVLFGLAFYHDFQKDIINKSGLDTFIVIISLISLMLNNLFAAFSSEYYEKFLSKTLTHLSYSLLGWFFLTFIANLLDFVRDNDTYFLLSFIIFFSAFIARLLSKLLTEKNKKNLVYFT